MQAPSLDIEHNLVLALTASVDVRGMPGVTRPDPQVREEDYLACLRYYINNHPRIRKLVFIENSNWPLDRLRTALDENPHGKDVEFISLNCNDFPRELGKSYGEFLLLERGFTASRLARDAHYLGKLTGRNFLMNLTQILARVREPFDLLCDMRDHGIYEMLGLPYCGRHADTRLLIFSHTFYDKEIRGRYVELNEGKGFFAENLIYRLAKHPPAGAIVLPRFPREPDFRGLAGHWSKDYGSAREVLKRKLRGATRRVAPWLHI
jgi:hypothetical protein